LTHNALAGFVIQGVLSLRGQSLDNASHLSWWLAVAVANLVLPIVPYALLIGAIIASGQRERRIIRQQLADEVGGSLRQQSMRRSNASRPMACAVQRVFSSRGARW
jgi:hypothetical protein